MKDLGIIFAEDGTFNTHILTTTAKGKKLAGWILRTIRARDMVTMSTLLKSLIQPTLEYGCPIWAPNEQHLIKALEEVQKSFTKKIQGLTHLTYKERLNKLGIYSLERRRDRYLIIHVWKAIMNIVPNLGFRIQSIDLNNGINLRLPNITATSKGDHALLKLKERHILYHGVRLFKLLPTKLRNYQETRLQ